MTARAIREPWNLLVAGAGAGAAWAIGLPVGAAGVVGAGMFGVAALAGGAIGGNQVGIDSTEPQQPLRPCSAQATLVVILRRYRSDLDDLRQTQSVPALAVTARHAADAARHAETIADRVARAIDRVDDAVSRGDRVAKQMPRSSQVQASVQRMKQRRADLLRKLTDAVEEVGERYTKLLELSTTADLLAVPADEVSAAGQLSDSLDAIREVFAELEMDASATRALL
jgi:hypothetical protein